MALKKAFDTMDYAILLRNLKLYGGGGGAIRCCAQNTLSAYFRAIWQVCFTFSWVWRISYEYD